jgi:hypothetical protein
MSFALPTAFWLAAFAAPIVIFYILKVRLRRQPVSTNLFWKQIYDEKPPRSIWQYLRHLLSLLAQLLILGLLVLAVADPYLPWQVLQARRLVVVVDRSASMRAGDVAPSRFEAAADAALAVVDGLRFRDEMAVVAAGLQPEVVIGMTSHVPTLKRAVRGIAVSDTPTDLLPAVELARQLIGEHPRGEVLVYTDGCVDALPEKSEPAPSVATPDNSKPQVRYFTFGSKASNVGITQFQIRRSLVDPLGYEALVSVTNASDVGAQCRLELELEGAPVDVIPLRLKPNEKWRRTLQKTSMDGGTLKATLTEVAVPVADHQDADQSKHDNSQGVPPASSSNSANMLASDDTAWAMLAARQPQPVLLVTEGNLFLQKVLEANPLVACTVVKGLPDTWPSGTIVVLHRQVPAQLPPNDLLVVEPVAGCDVWDVGEEIANPIVTKQDADSPLMTHVRLDNVLVPAARKLSFKSPPQVLAGTLSGDAIYAAAKRQSGKCLALTVDLERSDLAFRTAFPIMVTNALNWFRSGAGELQSAVATGRIANHLIASERLTKNAALILRSPSGREREIGRRPATSNEPTSSASATRLPELSLGPLDECGVWTLMVRESAERQTVVAEIAANLANERESDLRPSKRPLEEAAATLAGSWFARPLWFYIAALGCAVTVVEWLLHQRRVLT